ncbi:MAG: orotate phosphoribosyltransferase [Velocimicrobium sp.]
MTNQFALHAVKIASKSSPNLYLKAIPGHFATNHSHINYYLDMTTLKTRQSEAALAAKSFVGKYINNTVVDTIVCMDGTEIIGAYLAEELTRAGLHSMNSHETIYVVSPEYNSNGQMIFRDNIQPMITNKHIILLLASATTGKTILRCLECINYYRGHVEGVSAIFSAVDMINDINVDCIFHASDIPNYTTYDYTECPFCKNNQKLDALVNSYGYSKI